MQASIANDRFVARSKSSKKGKDIKKSRESLASIPEILWLRTTLEKVQEITPSEIVFSHMNEEELLESSATEVKVKVVNPNGISNTACAEQWRNWEGFFRTKLILSDDNSIALKFSDNVFEICSFDNALYYTILLHNLIEVRKRAQSTHPVLFVDIELSSM